MYSGYVLFCNNTSQEQCLRQRLYTCADKKTMPTAKVKVGSVIFLYNLEAKSLLGPFTALSEGGRALETGTWKLDIDEHSASENVKVEWEELHLMQNAPDKLPFLNDPKTCALSESQTQRVLDLLEMAPLYAGTRKNQE
jgi:hypothetical protein